MINKLYDDPEKARPAKSPYEIITNPLRQFTTGQRQEGTEMKDQTFEGYNPKALDLMQRGAKNILDTLSGGNITADSVDAGIRDLSMIQENFNEQIRKIGGMQVVSQLPDDHSLKITQKAIMDASNTLLNYKKQFGNQEPTLKVNGR